MWTSASLFANSNVAVREAHVQDDVICDVRSQSDFEENDARQDAERHLHWSSDDTVVVKSIPLAMEELKVRAEWELDIAGMAGTAPARKTKSVKSI
eukprot:2842663-Amphidinium_carterae.1